MPRKHSKSLSVELVLWRFSAPVFVRGRHTYRYRFMDWEIVAGFD